jgi:membrane-bound inhibitor of C-type lysozyme
MALRFYTLWQKESHRLPAKRKSQEFAMKKMLALTLPLLLTGCSYSNALYSIMMDKMHTDTLQYRCDEEPLTVMRDNAGQQVSFVYDNNALTLKQGLSALGERYTDGIYVFWEKGDSASVYRYDRVVLNNCRRQSS